MCNSYNPKDNPTSLWKFCFAVLLNGRKTISDGASEKQILSMNLEYKPQKVLPQTKFMPYFIMLWK